MIKNILKSKLFVLCLMLFYSLVVSVFCFGISSKAVTLSELRQYLTDESITMSDAYSQALYDTYYSNHSNYDFAVAYTYANNDSKRLFVMLYPQSIYDTVVYNNGQWLNGSSEAYGQNWSVYSCSYSSGSVYNLALTQSGYNQYGIGISSYYQGHDVKHGSSNFIIPIDWDNPLYSANIVAPYVNITYRDFTSVPTYDVPLNVEIGSNGNLYIEAFALFDIPTQVFAIYGRNGFDYQTLDKYTFYREIVSPESLKVPSDFSLDSFHLLMNDAWYNVASLINDQDIVFAFPDGLTNPHVQDTAKNRYYNLRKNQCMVGNNVYLSKV